MPAAAVRYCRQGVTFVEAVTRVLGVLGRKQGISGQALKGSQNMLMNDAMALDISFAERGAEAAADPALEVLYRSVIAQLERLNDADSEYARHLEACPADDGVMFIPSSARHAAATQTRRARLAKGK